MNTLQITSQKTAVLEEKDSRNSIRPVLEQAGFSLDFEKYSRTLSVFDGKQLIASIVWVKWIQDIITRGKYTPIAWIGSDVGNEIFSQRDMIQNVLQTWIGKCRLEYIIPNKQEYSWPLENINTIFTKYPETCKSMLYAYYDEITKNGKDALEWSPEWSDFEDICYKIEEIIQYSDSPDTTLADISWFQNNKRFAWWEIVETWNSLRELWLTWIQDTRLTQEVSTDIYARSGLQSEIFEFFLWKVKQALQEL